MNAFVYNQQSIVKLSGTETRQVFLKQLCPHVFTLSLSTRNVSKHGTLIFVNVTRLSLGFGLNIIHIWNDYSNHIHYFENTRNISYI
jgi:hypothetical protein